MISPSSTPLRIRKRHELPSALRTAGGTPAGAPRPATEPRAQFVEREPGVYDVIFTCRCGEQSVIRLESLERLPA